MDLFKNDTMAELSKLLRLFVKIKLLGKQPTPFLRVTVLTHQSLFLVRSGVLLIMTSPQKRVTLVIFPQSIQLSLG